MASDGLLNGIAGRWSGTYQLWLGPGDPVSASPSEATVTSELGGKSALLRYSWSYEGAEHHGLALISRNDDNGLCEMGWSDTFHYPGAVMHCKSSSPEMNVTGSYVVDGTTWLWRTSVELPSPNELLITAWFVDQEDEETLATEARYQRVV